MQSNSTGFSAIPSSDPEQQAFRQATRDCAQAMPGIFAWAIVAGMAMMQSGLTLWQALGMSFIVFAGSAQLAALPLIAAGASPLLVFLTALAVNLRFVIFGAGLAPHFAHLPWKTRLWYGYLNGDIVMGYFPQRYAGTEASPGNGKAGYYVGLCMLNWIVWQAGSVAGILMASRIPTTWGISFAGTLALLALLIPLVKNAAALSGVTVAGTVAVAGAGLPYRLGLLGGVVAGMAAALAVDSLCGDEEK
jgi:4-azaleucine resistance transporter AzlC